MKKIYDSEAGLKYLLYIILFLFSILTLGLVQVAPNVQGGLGIVFEIPYLMLILPYLPLIVLLTVCWDIIAEEKRVHKIMGGVLSVITVAFIMYVWFKVGLPLPG